MNKNLRNRFKLEVKNQFLIKLLLTAVLIYSSNQKVAGLDSGFMSPILSDVITDEASTNLLLSKEYADYKSVKLESKKITPPNLLDVSVSIVSDATNNSICRGTAVTFTATPTNGGSNPTYQWRRNGVNIFTGSQITLNNIQGNDQISVVMTTSLSAASVTNTTATSNTITLTVNNLPSVVSTTPASITTCTAAGSATINAVPTTGSVIDWYASTSSTTPLLTSSNSFTTPTISSTTTYYPVARDTATGCQSNGLTAQNMAISMGPNNAYIQTPKPVTGSFTIEFWFKPAGTSSAGCASWRCGEGLVDANTSNASDNDFGITIYNSYVAFGMGTGSTDVSILSTTNVSTRIWRHIAASWDSTSGAMKLYVNGNLEASAIGGTGSRNGQALMRLGSMLQAPGNGFYGYFSGSLDEVRVWSKVRTQADIQANYTTNLNGREDGLAAYYNFNQGIANNQSNGAQTTLNDITPNGNNGSLNQFIALGNTGTSGTWWGTFDLGFDPAKYPVVVTKITLPTVNSTTGSTICGSGTTTLTATANAGAKIDWYDSASGGSALATGIGTYTTPTLSATTTYYAEARDTVTGCVSTSRTAVTATVGAIPTAGITNNTGSTLLTCTRTSISVTATGGSTYSWSNSLGSSANASITAPGTYTVTVTSAVGCQATSSITVTRDVTAPTAGITNNTGSTVVTCTTTSISVTATGGSTYSWSNSLGSSANASITAAGTYTVTVTGSNGCTATSSITTTQNNTAPAAGITNNTGATILTCTRTSINVTATGVGSSYSWNNSLGSSASASITSPGTYTVTVTGANACTTTSSITVTQNITAPTAGITNNTGSTILNCTTPAISVTATGGASYSWSNSLGSSANASITAPGTYTVTATGANGCTSTASITVTQNFTVPSAGITNNTGSTVLTCSTTAISVTATGVGSYSWSNSLGSSAAASITSPGTFTVTVTGTSGCTSTASITATQSNTIPSAPVVTNGSRCGDGTVTLSATSGTGTVVDWYASALTSSPLLTASNTYTTTSLSSSTNYYLISRDTVTGCTSAKPRVTNALNFDGIDDNVNAGNGTSLQFNRGTIEAWIKTGNAGSQFRAIVCKQYAFGLFLQNNVLVAYNWNNLSRISTGINLADNSWHHVALSFDARPNVNTAKIYIDSILRTEAYFAISNQNDSMYIGKNTVSQQFSGTIDEVRVWNVARTQSEIGASMNSDLSGTESGLVAYYNFNQGVAGGTNTNITSLTDLTSNSNNASINNFTLTGNTSNFVNGPALSPVTVVTANVQPLPTVTSSLNGSIICTSGTTNLTATASAGAKIDWYADASGGTALATGIDTYTTPTLSATTTYYAEARDTIANCVSASRTAATATVNSATTAGITNNTGSTELTCIRTAISVTATGGSTYLWSNSLGTSANASITSPGTYTVTVTGSNGCTATASIAITQNLATSTGDTTVNVCNSFTWYGTTYTSSATPTHIFTNANGCDSIVTLHLTINAPPAQPTLACYETANLNSTTCSWVVTGTQPTMPTLACYETANFNTTNCTWDITGSQPAMPTIACYETASLNTTTCTWEVTGSIPTSPTLACYESANFNTTSCSWDVTGTQPVMPTMACYETATFNTTSCSWDVTGSQPSQPTLACYESITFNTTSCQWDVTGTQPVQPTLACYESATFNTSSCAWDVTGTQPTQPTLACYESANFNTSTCAWDVTGSIPTTPTLACYQTATFNTTDCKWDVTGTQPSIPTGLACYETATFNITNCAWVVTGSQPSMPTLACYESTSFNTTTCVWDLTGLQPSMPTLACYETASFNTTTCIWDVTGLQPTMPTLACYETANFNTNTCSWDVTGSQPIMPTLACYESANFNTSTCIWDVTGSQPTMPTLACYETANFNTTSCSWVVTGTQPVIPTLACYQTVTFNTTDCKWDITGTQPVQPTLACYESANFNTSTCVWDVTGTQPAMPTLACYESATFNTQSCAWDVTGTQPVQPSLACYESANFNTLTCAWDVTGTQPAMPTLACYESANFNTSTCAWDVTGSQPTQPTLACYETANFNTSTCIWDNTGTQPSMPTLACYESANFNTNTCSWDLTGTQPSQPSLACYESANFNTNTCSWDVTGSQPSQPTLACYESANFNTTSCSWVVTGSQPSMPTLTCYETANFNTNTCAWVVTGSQPVMPTLACYETANFNTTSCAWDVTGSQPSQPTLACYESANFNTITCSWDLTGTQPSQPSLACYESANFNTNTCSWDVTGSQPSMPTLACYETASFNTTTCIWDVTGLQPTIPTLACYETASFNTSTCVWDVTGTQPSIPTLQCYESANFNTSTCVWDVTGSQPSQPTLACYETSSFNTSTCVWDVTGSIPTTPTLACYETANFNTSTCVWDVTGTIPTTPTLACYESASFNTTTCVWDVTGTQPTMPTLACYETASFNTSTCVWDVTGTQPAMPTLACYETANFNTGTCTWDVIGSQPSQPTIACYESTNFYTTTCSWDVTGTQPSMPTLACYETASFNTSSCSWIVTGSQPSQPSLACYESANFNTNTCAWVVTGSQPTMPTLACYETANFNTTSCAWDVTGSQPSAPTGLACYETAIFNTTSCAWDIAGSQPAMPTLACYETASFNTATCAWVIIYNGTNSSTTQTACGTYTWNGSSYTQSGTYTYAYLNATGCASVDTLKLTINPFPSSAVAVSGTRCGTGTVTLTATSANGTVVDWYASSSATTPLLSASNTYTTPSISASVNYYVVARDTVTGCTSGRGQAVLGSALSLDGVNDFVDLPMPLLNSFTIEYWVKTSQVSRTGPNWWDGSGIVDAEVPILTTDFGTVLLNNKLAFGVGQPDVTIFSTTNLNTGNWTHVAATWDGSSGAMKLYINGTLEASGTSGTGARIAPSKIRIGSILNPQNYFNGSIDELRIWNVVRTQAQIENNYTNELTAQTGLVELYHFNQGVADGNNTSPAINTLIDNSGNNKNAPLSNFALTGSTSNWVAGVNLPASNTRAIVNAVVNPLPASAVGVDGSRYGTGTVSLSATVTTGNTVDWYAAATGGTALSTGSTAFTTPSIASTTIYYAEARNTTTGCVSAARTAVNATVNSILVVGVSISSNATNNSICKGTAITFTATPTNGGNTPTYQWKKNGINAGTGSSLTIDNILNNDVITVVMTTSLSSVSVNSTTATSNSITVTVNNLPSVISTTPANLTSCIAPGSATINAVPSTGAVIDWYASTSSTTPLLSSSNSFTTPTISATTTYYAVARDTVTGCQSNGSTAFSNALNFGSGIAYVQTTKPVTGSFTIEFWMNANYNSGAGNSNWRSGEGIVDASTSASNNDFGVTMFNDYVKFGLGNPDISITTTSKMNGTGWKHVAATWDSTSGAMKLYVNGLLEASATGGTASRNGQTAMRLGTSLSAPANWAYGNYSGTLDEVRIWSKVKTQADIQANMNNNLNGREASLVQYYNFNQGNWFGNNSGVTTLYDLTPNNYNGTLTNFSLLNGGSQMNYVAGIGLNAAQYPVTVTKSTIPTVTSTKDSTVCGSGTTMLTATASAGAKIDWYANATGGTALATGTNTFTTPNISATTVYYAEARDSVAGCVSLSRTAVTATIGVVPTAGITNNTSSTVLNCTTTAISVTATGGSTYLWSNSLGSSANASITSPGTYTVTVTGANGCTSTSSITITQNLTASNVGFTNNTGSTVLTCATNAISVTATGGTSYSWSNGLGSSASASITSPGTYTVTATAANGCTATSSITVTRDISTPTAGITNNTGFTILTCSRTSINVTATGGVSYSWNNGLGSLANASITSPGTHTVTVTVANGCTATASVTVTQDVTAATTNIVNNSFTTELNCNTQSITLSAGPSVIENFNNGQWDTTNFTLGAPTIGSGSVVNGGYIDPSDSRSPLRTVNQFHPDANHILTVSATIKFTFGQQNIGFIATRSSGTIVNAHNEPDGAKMRIHNFNDGQTTLPNGYHALLTNTFYYNPVRVTMIDNGTSITSHLVNLVTLADTTFTVNTSTSNGDYVTFSGGGSNYWDDIQISYGNSSSNISNNWVNGNGVSIANTSSINVTSPGTYSVNTTAANGCTSTESIVITQNIATSTGDTTASACNNFTWYGTTYTSSGTPTHTLNNVNGCDSVVTLHLTINTPPALPILACYETASLNSTTCSWVVTGSQPAMPTLTCYQTANFNTSTCSWDVTGSPATTITTTITNCGAYTWSTNGQEYTQSGTYNSNINCQDYTLNLTVLPTTTYYADADVDGYGNPSSTILACNGAPIGYVSQSSDCNDTSYTAHPGAIEICGNGIDDNCDGQIDEGASVVTNPISGNLQICGLYAGAKTLTTATIPGISTYNWTVPTDITITSGQGTNTITVYWDNIYLLANGIIGEVTVSAMGTTTGCGTLVPAKLLVDLNYTAPVTPPSISGPSAICPSESGIYSIALVKRASSYEWSVPAGATLNSGNGSNIINVSYGSGFTGGNITVGARNVCGLSTPLRSRTVTLNILPPPVSITGPVDGLCNASNANYLVTSLNGATGYVWTVPSNATIVGGSNGNNITVNYNTSFSTGNISVAAINNCGVGSVRSLAVKASPATPASITGPVTTCAGSNQTYSIATVQGASNYTWTVPNGATINSGQGSKVININHATVASVNGIITVKSSNACGTSALKVLSVATTACPRLGEANVQLQVYPNPASTFINVSFIMEVAQQVNISLRDASGRVVYNEAIDAASGFNSQQIELSNLAKGVYFVQLQTASSSENTRLIIK